MGKYSALIQNRRFVSGKEMFKDVLNKETASSLLYKYKKRNIIVQVRKNVYLPTNPTDGFIDENKYEIACNSVPNSYISYLHPNDSVLLNLTSLNMYMHLVSFKKE